MEDDFDRTARYLLKQAPRDHRDWLLAGLDADLEWARFLDTQLIGFPKEPQRRCDTVAELVSAAGTQPPWAAVLEPQGYPDADFLLRLLQYLAMLAQELRHGPYGQDRYQFCAAVVNLGEAPIAEDFAWVPPTAGRRRGLEWCLWVKNLRTEDAAATLAAIAQGALGRAILPWVPLMAGAEAEAIAVRWRQLAEAETDVRRRDELAVLALILAEKAGRTELWQRVLEGFNVARATLLVEAEKRGTMAAVREDVQAVAEARFGAPLPPDLKERLEKQLEVGTLRRWLAATARAANVEECRADWT